MKKIVDITHDARGVIRNVVVDTDNGKQDYDPINQGKRKFIDCVHGENIFYDPVSGKNVTEKY